ncbi:39S ribosomal protein L32 [Cricetulus griseus]|uniref:Large ribosomal subunit protein bL32m n=1 Tax=Cricetulus griseus TaxID=10029 RepID=A0A061I8D5_CRIGR|nr:39S ribosomal protein L32 [Cricetulus griseus]
MHPTPARNMASALLLLHFPWPARPLRRCSELLQQLQRSWKGVASPQWGPGSTHCDDGLLNNIDICPECGHLKQKHVLCGYCYEKVRKETTKIRQQIWAQEGGPFKAPTVETVVLYTGEKPSEQDQGKRIVERNMKRPSWFTQN